uniref:C-type cytochrome biogenesis protein CcsB n=1 Tax=Streptomyces violaceusniger TaxID=68280 RepID=A0A6F8Z293_STRVO|nr:c-type cytochrome biogenesis protein CcsB [Streptomyces violaceusniger]
MTVAASVNENLAQLSNYLIYSAMAVYTLAFLAHIGEWTFGTRSRVAVQSRALTDAEPAAGQAAKEAANGAATVSAERGRGGAATLERPRITVRTGPGDRGIEDGPGAAGDSERGDVLGRIAIGLTTLAWAFHTMGVIARGASVQRAPWANMYEFSTTFGAITVGVYLGLLALKKPVRWLGLFMVTTILLDLGLAVSVLYTDSDQLVPALHSYWLWIHVSCAMVSGGALYLGALSAVLYLCRDRYEAGLPQSEETKLARVWSRLPSAATLDKFAYRINAAIFPLWTFAIVAGAIWAEAAWGRYWGWDPKEVWTFITWVAYAAYLHARSTAGWRGRKAAYLALIAFACFLFNYYGVNIFVSGKHSYSGV